MKVVDYKVPGGKMLKIKLTLEGNAIESVTILGDFFLHPESTIEAIEDSLIGSLVDIEHIIESIQTTLERCEAVLIGATATDIANAIEKAARSE